MRATRALLGFLLAGAAGAQHHHHRHRLPAQRDQHGSHHHHHDARKADLEGQTVTITDHSRTEATTIPEVVVFVDDNDNPVSTATAVVELAPPADAARGEAVLQETSSPDELVGASPKVGAQAVKKDTLGSQKGPWPGGNGLPSKASNGSASGVAYAPYNADGSCKSAHQIMADFLAIAHGGFGLVRVYGVDCNQIPSVYAAAKKINLRVMYGLFSLDNLGDQVATLTAGIQSDWSNVDTVSVGNELVNNGQAQPSQIQAALAAAKQLLASAGWTGPVVTVDTFIAALAHPELCSSSDYCAVNIHPFFDPNTPAEQAGTFVLNQIQNLRTALGNPTARIRVTESGWPWQGLANGLAVPGVDQQAAAIASIRAAFADNPEDVFLFSAFNDRWKVAAPETFNAEQFWGIGAADCPNA